MLAAGSEEWTITLWIKPISLASNASNHGTMNCFLAKASDPSNDNLEFGVQTNNDLHLYIDTQPKDSQMDFGKGELKKALKIENLPVSKEAQVKIEKAGGEITVAKK